ncbi:ATP-binding cassette domain-containing protein, partial [Romboutsia sp. 1001216sp1]
MNIGVKVENLSYSFKNQKILDDINIDFHENKIYGLLGKNGAGKTTLLNIITNQLLSKEGKIYIKGVE